MSLEKGFYTKHIEELKKVLSDIYTVDKPEGYMGTDAKTINVMEKLETAKDLERLYSSIEDGFPSGKVFEKYSGYLVSVRNAIVVLESEKEIIEKEHAEDIENAELMLKVFEEHL